MKKLLLSVFLVLMLVWMGKAQLPERQFDTAHFNKLLVMADHLIESEFCTQMAIRKFSKPEDSPEIEWFSYQQNGKWCTVGGNVSDNTFQIIHHVSFDSLFAMSDYAGPVDTSRLTTSAKVLALANNQFQIVRDTTGIYFDSFVINNPDQTISIFFVPAFQPSGQALYGCEWEYIYNNTGTKALSRNAYINRLTGVWIGQPRELWLNYRNTDKPTLGSVYFALSFRDFFTRLRIDTRISTSTVAKNASGIYTWIHKMKNP